MSKKYFFGYLNEQIYISYITDGHSKVLDAKKVAIGQSEIGQIILSNVGRKASRRQ